MSMRGEVRQKFRKLRATGMEFILAHKVSKILARQLFFRWKAEELGATVTNGCECCGDWDAVFVNAKTGKKTVVDWFGNIN